MRPAKVGYEGFTGLSFLVLLAQPSVGRATMLGLVSGTHGSRLGGEAHFDLTARAMEILPDISAIPAVRIIAS